MPDVVTNYVSIDGEMEVEEVVQVARKGKKAYLSLDLKEKIRKSRQTVEDIIAENRIVYGINTGFGKFCEVSISAEKCRELQRNLICSHAAGVGPPFSEEVVRAIMLLRINALSLGHSGIREEVLNLLLEMLNRGVHPVIPSQGSLGASGDLAPLSHMALVMIGEGEAYFQGSRLPGEEALKAAELEPVELQEKEGLALINGTQVMTALGSLAWYDAINLSKAADMIGALTMEALKARWEPFNQLNYKIRPHFGYGATLRNINKMVKGSANLGSDQTKTQDAYSIRCLPQVHGASKDALNYIKGVLAIEINSVTDNPLVFPEENTVISAGNFHGQPVGLAMDFFATALAELGSISERRLERLLNSNLSGLPPFLTTEGGLSSGYMIAQYTAASLVSENKVYSHPASVDSLPVSASQEDHVSMGTNAARKACNVVTNVAYILAAEYLAAAQGLDLSDNLGLGEGSRCVYRKLRDRIPYLQQDRLIYPELEKVASMLKEGELVQENEVGRGIFLEG